MDSESWNDRYREAATQADTVWSLEPNVWVAETVARLEPGTAVDLAAGEGRNALWLASLGWRVTAVDFAAVGLATGAARAEHLGLEVAWTKADATTWRSPEPVDLVVVAYLQLPAPEIATVIGNAAASLAPGGTLALIGHDRDNLERGVGGPQDPAVLLTVDELRSAASGFEVVECRQYERRTVDGKTAIDAILVARKI